MLKPHVKQTLDGEHGPEYVIEFANGQTGRVWADKGFDEWRLQLDGAEPSYRKCITVGYAFESLTIAAYLAAGFVLVPVAVSADFAKRAEAGDLLAYTKTLRQVLKARTGRPWSVKVGRGTAYCWVHVETPKARLVEGQPTAEDQALLEAATGKSAHGQGFSIPPTRGYQAALLLHAAAGHSIGIELSEHNWD